MFDEAPDLGAGRVDRERQALAAERLGTGYRVPARRGPSLVGVGPAGGGGDFAGVERDPVLIADLVQRRQHVGGEFPGFLQHRGGDVGVEIAVMAGLHGGLEAGAMVESEQHVVDRRAVGHRDVSHLAVNGRSSHETADLSTLRGPKSSPAGTGRRPVPGEKARISREVSPQYKETGCKANSTAIPGSSLLKWLNSLYRPAEPKGNPRGPRSPAFQTAFGASPSGKAVDFDSTIRRFEILPPQPATTKPHIRRARARFLISQSVSCEARMLSSIFTISQV